MKVNFKTLGCRLNEAELQTWAEQLRGHGYQIAQVNDADCIVINSCAVTAEGARKSRQQIRKMHRENPAAKLVVTGCYASLEPTTVQNMLGVDLVIDNQDKDSLADKIIETYGDGDISMPHMATEPGAYAMFQRSRDRAFIKIQDGCRYRCTYCIVTVARGEERSRPITELIDQVNDIYKQGIQEVVLAGVHVGGYGSDISTNLYDLVKALLEETDIPRIRFASVEPWDLPEHFFELFENNRLMPHMHLPLQSGSDSVLRRMSRRCRQDTFKAIIENARACHPDFNVTTDIIVGFPGETDQEWQDSINYINEIGFSHIHCFSYSDREGTKAYRLKDKVSGDIKKERMNQLNQAARKMRHDYLSRQIGQTVDVLWESGKQPHSNSQWLFTGYTPNFTKIETVSDVDLSGQILETTIIGQNEERQQLIGTIDQELSIKLHPPIALKTL